MQNEITHGIHAKEINQLIGIQYISFGFAHLAVALQQPRMSEYLFRKRQIQCHQKDRPVNGMETDDILTDQMQICRPVFLELLAAVSVTVITDTGDVVGQCIQPYINDMFRIKIYRNAPFKGSTGYAQILQSRKKEVVHHLIFSGNRLDKFRMGVDMLDQTVCIFAHTEEISFFFCRLHFTSAVRTFAVHQLRLGKKRLARCTVHTFIMSLVNISLIVQFFEDLLYLFFVVCIRCTDKFIVRCVHQIPDSLDFCGNFIHKSLRCHTFFFCFQLNLLTVFIGSGLEEHIISLLSLKTGNAVCQHDLVSVSDMRFAGCIGNRSCHIKFLFIHFCLLYIVRSNAGEGIFFD